MAHDVGYYHTEVCFLLYIAYYSRVKRGQERFKSEFLEARRPTPSPFEKRDHGKKAAVSIRKLILEAGEAFVSGIKCSHNSRTNGMQRVRNYIQATFLILDVTKPRSAEQELFWQNRELTAFHRISEVMLSGQSGKVVLDWNAA